MRNAKMVRPSYADGFRCIGPTCEDSCCAGWEVNIDKATYQKYQSTPAGPLRVLMDAHIVRTPEDPGGKNPSTFARVKLLPSMECPFHNAERLCQIQVELGEEYLSHTCATYPRRSFVIDKLVDKTLTTSCPEACRLVLLNPNLLESDWTGERHMKWDDSNADPTLVSYFWPIREFVIGLIQDRTYPLWQRMFLLGTFSRRLEAVIRGEIKGGFTAMLEGFSAAVASGGLRASIETIPADLALQLGMVLELVNLRPNMHAGASPCRMYRCLRQRHWIRPRSTLQSMSAEYGMAYERYFAPFLCRASLHPGELPDQHDLQQPVPLWRQSARSGGQAGAGQGIRAAGDRFCADQGPADRSRRRLQGSFLGRARGPDSPKRLEALRA